MKRLTRSLRNPDGGIRPTDLEIVFTDEDFVVVNKPSGLLSIPDRFRKHLLNLHDLLSQRFAKVHPVNRLDRDTSGLVVFARNSEANVDLSDRFARQEIQKTYLALVKGEMPNDEGVIDAPIGEHPDQPGLMKIDRKTGKPAVTEYRVVERFKGLTLIEAKPRTGRQHQIRVHLAHIGFPLAVDSDYGGAGSILLSAFKKSYKPGKEGESPLIGRLSLHSWKLSFHHFRRNDALELIAPLPRDFEVALKQLRKYAAKTMSTQEIPDDE
ncbi:MAG TPA: RluA family pseudouridine synthase [Candidatus Ozemobacteraceae bacterium]|mgnify:CR=1 FL=1|nr:RluA family pseudouridine synthase [Candidatus Ozemobacteraceae bacterium]